MSKVDLHGGAGGSPVDGSRSVPVPPGPLDPPPNVDDARPLAPAGQHGGTGRSFLRRQPVRIVKGGMEGGYTSAFEVICYDCGDNPYLDYCEVSPRLQRIRGPYTMRDGLAAYEEHLALTT
jgi:hypothetical protein